jgi:hypothetical protein
VHDRDDVVLREGLSERSLVPDIADNQRTGDDAAMAGLQIVVSDRVIAGRDQRPAAM